MQKYQDEKGFLTKIPGTHRSYECYEVRERNLRFFDGESLLCIANYVLLPHRLRFLYAAYHENLHSFKQLKFDHIVYSFIFIPVNSELEADAVLQDILQHNPTLYDQATSHFVC